MAIQNVAYLVIGFCLGTLWQVTFRAWEDHRILRQLADEKRQEVLERRRGDLEANGVYFSRYLDPDDLG